MSGLGRIDMAMAHRPEKPNLYVFLFVHLACSSRSGQTVLDTKAITSVTVAAVGVPFPDTKGM